MAFRRHAAAVTFMLRVDVATPLPRASFMAFVMRHDAMPMPLLSCRFRRRRRRYADADAARDAADDL